LPTRPCKSNCSHLIDVPLLRAARTYITEEEHMAKLVAQQGRDGQWRVYARAFLFQNPGGKQVVTTQTCYGSTEKEALSAGAKFIADERNTYQHTGKASRKPCKETLAVYGRPWLDARKPTGA